MTQAILASNSNLSRSEFTQRVTHYLQHVTRKYNKLPGRERMKNVLLDIERYGRYNDEEGIGIAYNWTAYAVRWSYETLRLNLAPEHALEGMKVHELVQLVHELTENCPTQIDVTHYLNKKFDERR